VKSVKGTITGADGKDIADPLTTVVECGKYKLGLTFYGEETNPRTKNIIRDEVMTTMSVADILNDPDPGSNTPNKNFIDKFYKAQKIGDFKRTFTNHHQDAYDEMDKFRILDYNSCTDFEDSNDVETTATYAKGTNKPPEGIKGDGECSDLELYGYELDYYISVSKKYPNITMQPSKTLHGTFNLSQITDGTPLYEVSAEYVSNHILKQNGLYDAESGTYNVSADGKKAAFKMADTFTAEVKTACSNFFPKPAAEPAAVAAATAPTPNQI
jgi:hypothetical protein